MGKPDFVLHPLDVWLVAHGLKPYQFAETNKISLHAIYESVNGHQLNPKLDLLYRIAAGTDNEVTIQMQADWLVSLKRGIGQSDPPEPDLEAVADAHEDPDDFAEEADEPPDADAGGADEVATEIGPI